MSSIAEGMEPGPAEQPNGKRLYAAEIGCAAEMQGGIEGAVADPEPQSAEEMMEQQHPRHGEDDNIFATPKLRKWALTSRPPQPPPAPRKPRRRRRSTYSGRPCCRRLSSCSNSSATQVSFFIPSDLHTLPDCIRTLFRP